MDLPWRDGSLNIRDLRSEPLGPRHLAAMALALLVVALGAGLVAP